ncbi:hypothetical protein LSH36_783g00005 [Paralvinella palmiformis]|uniref:Uncharacterized protein n=1 Tax=Paralvinella palmiformis TaxID=53620 RepID=A0AAD9J124_9ANNE|nr:hypothetical protein LSH36_783g00005 [Paralvinella palmiformis]
MIFSEHHGKLWTNYSDERGNPQIAGDEFRILNSTESTLELGDVRPVTVPKYVHLIWFYPKGTNFRFHHLMCLMSIKLHIKPQRIIVWYSQMPKGPWWAFARKTVWDIALMPYQVPTAIFNQSVSIIEHQSDIARLDILIKYGGIYFDFDVIALKDLGPLLRYPVTLGAETPYLLGSGVILAQPNASFLHLWKDSYRDYQATEWNYNSVVVPMKLAKNSGKNIHIEWFSIHRPNWFERQWLYTEGRLWNWSENFAIHLWYRSHDKEYDPVTIRRLNTTVGEIFRFIYYGNATLLSS